MARKIKLPLDMGNDVKVRDIEELKENYNSEKVVESFLNGELLPWLQDRFYEEEAERVEALSADRDNGNIAGRLAEIFGVHIENEVDVEEIEERNERLAKLRSITSDDEVLRNVDLVAFSQEDMDIVHESDVIYLCGNKFRISPNLQGKKYIGVNNPTVEIKVNGIGHTINLAEKNIIVENCTFTEDTLAILHIDSIENGIALLEKSDYSESLKCFKKAAEEGDPEGEFQYAQAYEYGRGVEADLETARKWYEKAANDGSAKACNSLGIICRNNDRDTAKAREWFTKGLKIEELPELFYNLGTTYQCISNLYDKERFKSAEEYFLKAAKKNYAPAFYELGTLYIDAGSEFIDLEKSEYWLTKDLHSEIGESFLKLCNRLLIASTTNAEKVLKYCDFAIKKLNNDPENKLLSEFTTKRTYCLYQMGQISEDEAISLFKAYPKNRDSVLELIKYYKSNGDSEKFEEYCSLYYRHSLGDDSLDNEEYLEAAADYYYIKGKNGSGEEAEDAIDYAISIYRETGTAHACLQLARIYTFIPSQRDLDFAEDYLNKIFDYELCDESDPIYDKAKRLMRTVKEKQNKDLSVGDRLLRNDTVAGLISSFFDF